MTPSSIQSNPAATLIADVAHDDLAALVNTYYWQKQSWVVWLHYAFSLAILAVIARVALLNNYGVDDWLTGFGLAVIGFVVLIPIHEALHGLVYKLLGAQDVRFKVALRQFMAYAIAHNFAANARQFFWVAVTPFVVINAALILAAVLLPPFSFYFWCTLLIHTSGTSGDWALLNLMWLNRGRPFYTWDDADAHRSYFYVI